MKYVNRLIHLALSQDMTLSVWDGEEWTVEGSRSAKEVREALASTDMDNLFVRASEGRYASFLLVWGLEEDETIADYTDNELGNELYNQLEIN
jgi:hypothetical protein